MMFTCNKCNYKITTDSDDAPETCFSCIDKEMQENELINKNKNEIIETMFKNANI